MPIETFSWSHFGFRKIPDTITGCAGFNISECLQKIGGYEVRDGKWIRHPRRIKNSLGRSISVAKELDGYVDFDSDELSFVDEYYKWRRALEKAGVQSEYAAKTADLIDNINYELKENADKPWYAFKAFGNALNCIDNPIEFRTVLSQFIIRPFFKNHPDGKILFIRHDPSSYLGLISTMRAMYTRSQFSDSDLKALGIQSFETMRQWHTGDGHSIFEAILRLVQYLWFPYVSGVVTGPFAMNVVFVFSEQEEYVPGRFPESWLSFLSHDYQFATERRNFKEAVANYQGSEYWRLAHNRPLETTIPPVEDRVKFIKWLVTRLEEWIFNISDMANFGELANEECSPVFAFEHLISIDRIIRRLSSISVSREMGNAKNIAFELTDLYSTLKHRFDDALSEVDYFKQFYNPSEGRALIRNRLSRIPGIGTYLQGKADECFDELEVVVMESVWHTAKIQNDGVLVRNKHLTTENVESKEVFVANVIRALRNGHHGYFTEGDNQKRPSRYLSMVTGETPDTMVRLPVYQFLAYLEDNSLFGWSPLGLSRYPK